jgi:hypothetical protein
VNIEISGIRKRKSEKENQKEVWFGDRFGEKIAAPDDYNAARLRS